MSARIALDNYYVILTHALTLVISIFISGYIFMMAKKNRLLYLYLLTQLMLILWVFSKILKTAAPTIHLRWFFIVTQYFGICFLGSVFVMFAYTYTFNKAMKLPYAILLNIPSAVLFLIVATNPLHMTFYATFDMYHDTFGPIFYYHQIMVYLYLICGIILCSKGFKKQFENRRVQAALFAVAIMLPIAVNLLYVFKVLKKVFGIRLPMDITPISCIISLLIFAIAAFRYRFLDITPLAFKEVLRQAADAILLIDNNGVILDYNTAFDLYFLQLQPTTRILSVEDFLCLLKSQSTTSNLESLLKSQKLITRNTTVGELSLSGGSSFEILIEPVFHHKNKHYGSLIRFKENSIRKEMLHTLSENNRALAEGNLTLEKKAEALRQLTIIKVRSSMAKELHDILGHSVVLVLAMLEVALLNLKNGNVELKEYLSHSITLLKTGLEEIEKSTQETSNSKTDNIILDQSLQLIAEQLKASGIVLEITMQGQPYGLDSSHCEALYKICREAITNAVRHGKASLINIIFRFYTNHYELYIINNGIGCNVITKGMGLKGMEGNASAIGGSLHCNSSPDGGFQIFLSIENKGPFPK